MAADLTGAIIGTAVQVSQPQMEGVKVYNWLEGLQGEGEGSEEEDRLKGSKNETILEEGKQEDGQRNSNSELSQMATAKAERQTFSFDGQPLSIITYQYHDRVVSFYAYFKMQ